MGNKYNTQKDLLRELVQYGFCYKETIDSKEVDKYSEDDSVYVEYKYNNKLCTLDKYTNTRILLGIFKCVNTIKNILIAGIVLGIVGVVLSMFIGK